jgi:hypothetical protein
MRISAHLKYLSGDHLLSLYICLEAILLPISLMRMSDHLRYLSGDHLLSLYISPEATLLPISFTKMCAHLRYLSGDHLLSLYVCPEAFVLPISLTRMSAHLRYLSGVYFIAYIYLSQGCLLILDIYLETIYSLCISVESILLPKSLKRMSAHLRYPPKGSVVRDFLALDFKYESAI